MKERILKLLENREMTIYGIAKKLGLSWTTAKFYLLELLAEGKVKKIEKNVGLKRIVLWKTKNQKRRA